VTPDIAPDTATPIDVTDAPNLDSSADSAG
jgi:hypothetical protein